MYTSLGDLRVWIAQTHTSAYTTLPYLCWSLDTDVIADVIQVLLDGVGEMWLRFPGITQNNDCLGTSMKYTVGKNFSP